LIWRSTELVAQEVEKEINDGEPVIVNSHKAVQKKKKTSLEKYMRALKSLIWPDDPEEDEFTGNEDLLMAEDVFRKLLAAF
jgi:hypothetical protein